MGHAYGGESFSADSANDVLREVCSIVGLNYRNARLLRLGENALYHIDDASTVVRIARNMDHWGDAVKEVAVAEWLSAHGFPAASTADFRQPLEVNNHPVTFWDYISSRNGGHGDIADLAALLAKLHSMPAPEGFRLPRHRVFDRVRPRIESSQVSSADKDLLLERCEQLEHEVGKLTFTLSAAPIHGDAHVQNLMVVDGRPVLIDFERFSWGQPEWDLSMTATEYRTAGWWTDAEYGQFVDAYGFDVTEWDGFDVLRSTHEIKMTTWIMQNVRESPEIAAEYAARMKTIRAGHPVGAWTPF